VLKRVGTVNKEREDGNKEKGWKGKDCWGRGNTKTLRPRAKKDSDAQRGGGKTEGKGEEGDARGGRGEGKRKGRQELKKE